MAASRPSGSVASTGQKRSVAASATFKSWARKLGLVLRDRRALRIAEVAVADRPVAGRAKVRVRATGVLLGHAMEPLEAFGKIDGRLWYLDHGRTRSNTRPRNQKFSTPAHSA